jgi:hypothetical protein
MGLLDIPKVLNPKGVLVTDGPVSDFLEKVIKELEFVKVPAYASGNKVFFFLDSTVRKNVHNYLYKKQDYLFYTIIV